MSDDIYVTYLSLGFCRYYNFEAVGGLLDTPELLPQPIVVSPQLLSPPRQPQQ